MLLICMALRGQEAKKLQEYYREWLLLRSMIWKMAIRNDHETKTKQDIITYSNPINP